MAMKLLSIEQILAILGEGPERIAASTAGLSPEQLRTPPAPGEWSANENLAHLRACGDMWGKAIATILAQDHATFRAVNPRTWIQQTDYPDLDFRPSLTAFTAQRAELLALLRPLQVGDWSRSATVSGAGKPLELTVQSYGDRMAAHERAHVKQIARIAEVFRTQR